MARKDAQLLKNDFAFLTRAALNGPETEVLVLAPKRVRSLKPPDTFPYRKKQCMVEHWAQEKRGRPAGCLSGSEVEGCV